MLARPRFKPHLHVEVVPGEGVFVLSGAHRTLLKGRLYELVVPHVGAGRTGDEVCDQAQDQVRPAEVYFVLNQLERKGYLCEEDAALPPNEAALWSAQGVDARDAARRLAETSISVHSYGADDGPVRALLQALRVRVEEHGSLSVVLADGYLRPELRAENERALRDGRPWLLVRPNGGQIWVGPLFLPGQTGCWECLALRLRANSPVESYLAARRNGRGGAITYATDPASSPATLGVGSGLAAHAVAAWIIRGALPELEGKIRSLDLASWHIETHSVVRLPYCPACGATTAAEDTSPRPIVLERRTKIVTSDGGHRVVGPEVTLGRYGHHVSPITGAVTMLERVGPERDGAFHVYLAGNNLARGHASLNQLRGDLRNMSSGKGASDAQARASGLCEGLERYSGVFRGDEPRRRARAEELGGSAPQLNDCLLFSERQFRERDAWNARKSRYNFVPLPLDPEAEIDWTPVWSLTRKEARYLPTAFCYYDYPQPDAHICMACSNGNAAGNTLEEAVLQGFLELVERDSVALWWYNRVRRPGVDLSSFADPYLARVHDFLASRGREFWALDLTSDLGVPVFAAVSRALDGPDERIMLGFGAHLDAPLALVRAVTEMNQMLSWIMPDLGHERRDDAITDAETNHWLRTATVSNQPYLLPDAAVAPRLSTSYPRTWADDITDDIRSCRVLVEQRGMEMLVLDQTRPEIGLPVAKVIVPGLRHFWARFAPGRLYDVPAQLGWVDRPLAEEELNPLPMFL
jgi:ribosomal protein S12 methylthiotransferase accessory factor